MTITKFEQSGFIIQSDNGYRIAIDIGNKTPTHKLSDTKVDAVLISHIHGDHFYSPNIAALKPRHIFLPPDCAQSLDRSIFEVTPHIWPILPTNELNTFPLGADEQALSCTAQLFSVDHGPNATGVLDYNYGFLLTVDELTIYSAGDMFYESGINVSDLAVDYLLLPIGTYYTFGPTEALDFACKFASVGTIIPMHYDLHPETLDEFLSIAERFTVTAM